VDYEFVELLKVILLPPHQLLSLLVLDSLVIVLGNLLGDDYTVDDTCHTLLLGLLRKT
jgi:hypothetical protein